MNMNGYMITIAETTLMDDDDDDINDVTCVYRVQNFFV